MSTDTPDTDDWNDLKAFARDLLVAIAELDSRDSATYGLALKQHLEAEHGYDADADDEEGVYQHRLYSTLTDLEERGIVTKNPVDGRTKKYGLTDRGRALLDQRADRYARVTDSAEAKESGSR